MQVTSITANFLSVFTSVFPQMRTAQVVCIRFERPGLLRRAPNSFSLSWDPRPPQDFGIRHRKKTFTGCREDTCGVQPFWAERCSIKALRPPRALPNPNGTGRLGFLAEQEVRLLKETFVKRRVSYYN